MYEWSIFTSYWREQVFNCINRYFDHTWPTLLEMAFFFSLSFSLVSPNCAPYFNEFQKRQRRETVNAAKNEIDKRLHYFALKLQKRAIDFYCTLSEDTTKGYDENIRVFREHYNEKPVVFQWRLYKRAQQRVEKFKDSLGYLQKLALKL